MTERLYYYPKADETLIVYDATPPLMSVFVERFCGRELVDFWYFCELVTEGDVVYIGDL